VGWEERQRASTAELFDAVTHPRSRILPLSAAVGPTASSRAGTTKLAAAYVPGTSRLYLFGSMPEPRPERVYQVWLGRAGVYVSVATFVPGTHGLVVVRVQADPTAFDALLITEEPGSGSQQPSSAHVVETDL